MTHRGILEDSPRLEAQLQAKEQRSARQQQWLHRYRQPVISLTLVTPGQVKDCARYQNVMGVAIQIADHWLRSNGWPVNDRAVRFLPTGPEALWSVSHSAAEIKAQLVEIEQTHPIGRLWDFDVICPQSGPVGRISLNQHGRLCLVCDQPALCCIRGRRHSAEEILHAVEKIIDDWFNRR